MSISLNIKAHVFSIEDRSEEIKMAVHKAYKAVVETEPTWKWNGSPSYNILAIEDRALIRGYIKKHSDKKEFSIVDMGGGDGTWARTMAEYLHPILSHEGAHAHIYSVAGDNLPDECIKFGYATYYRLSCFAIENLQEELSEREKQGKKSFRNIDVVVSSMTFLHLVDEWGTLKGICDEMAPGGLVAIRSFYGWPVPDQHYSFGSENYLLQILHNLNIPFLMRFQQSARDRGNEFILQMTVEENEKKKIEFPLMYEGDVYRTVPDGCSGFHDVARVKYMGQKEDLDQMRKRHLEGYPVDWVVYGDKDLFDWIFSIFPGWDQNLPKWRSVTFIPEEVSKALV